MRFSLPLEVRFALPREMANGAEMIRNLLCNLAITVNNFELIELGLMTFMRARVVDQIGRTWAGQASGCLRVPS